MVDDFKLPELPYAMDALEPYISENTLSYHYGKHHATYLNNLNNLVRQNDLLGNTLENIISIAANNKALTGVFNNAAQVWNHTFYWHSMKPEGGGMPIGKLMEQIEKDFDNYDNFINNFKEAGKTQFGSGWTWLVWNEDKLQILKTANADTPIITDMIPLLTVDVWEHAYYLDYQNARPEYLNVFFDSLVNWEFAQDNFDSI